MVYNEKEFLEGLVSEGWNISGSLKSVLLLRNAAPETLLRVQARIEGGGEYYTTASLLIAGEEIPFKAYESPDISSVMHDFYLRVKSRFDAYMHGDTNVPRFLEVFFAYAIPPLDRWPSHVPTQLLTGRNLQKASLNLAEKHHI